MTGVGKGVITINIVEADPAHRECAREQMSEAYRTLVGHFRQESEHDGFDRLLSGTPRIEDHRALFGDERQHTMQSLQRHDEHDPAVVWSERFVIADASSPPVEDRTGTRAHSDKLWFVHTLAQKAAQQTPMT